ncbi:MAG TPA: tetratricopeptide repeat protein [Kofleriaceae bacterium]|nr:tetratricopeptide repeat protein [Kofleriaceae bacterium]
MEGKLGISLVILATLAACPGHPEESAKKSNDRLAIAKDFLGKGQFEAAESESDKAIAYLSTNEEAYNVRGLSKFLRAVQANQLLEVDDCVTGIDSEVLRKKFEDFLAAADKDFAKAAELAPDYGEAWANRGIVATLDGDNAAAVGFLTHALENPARLIDIGIVRSNLGWAYFKKGEMVQAAAELLSATQYHPHLCVPTYRLGRVYFERKEWEKAAEQFQDVSDQPACHSQEARLYLMKTRIQQGLMDEARAARDACLALSPKSCVAAQCRAAGF